MKSEFSFAISAELRPVVPFSQLVCIVQPRNRLTPIYSETYLTQAEYESGYPHATQVTPAVFELDNGRLAAIGAWAVPWRP